MTTPAPDDEPASTHIHGNVTGDVVGGDKTVDVTAGGDIVGGHKVTQTGTGNIFTGAGHVLVIQQQLSPASIRDRANLSLLLNKVKAFWIEGVLERSIHTAGSLALGLELRAEAVDHPWASVLELPDASRRQLPPGTAVSQVFDEANRALLILGEPGSGKTTTLLELARDLVARAEGDAQGAQPVPVVFNLSGWHTQRLPLGAWMASELASKYQVPTRLGRAWLREQRLLPLLDGLDEVAPAWQAACVTAINQYAAGQGVPGIAVCCRLGEYTRLPARLRLNAAVCLSPLNTDQINTYLAASGDRLAALRQVMQGDDVLAVLAQTPLFLSIMRLAYQDLPHEALAGPALSSVEARRRHLLGQYVASMLRRKGTDPGRFADGALVQWLTWLARQMAEHNQTVYLIERMQPSWLSGRLARWAYALAARASAWWLLGLGWGVGLVLMFVMVGLADKDFAAGLAAIFPGAGVFDYLQIIFGLAGEYAFMGLLAGLITGLRFEINWRRRDAAPGGWQAYLRPIVNVISASVIPALIVIPLFWDLSPVGNGLAEFLLMGLLGLQVVVLSAIALRAWESGHSLHHDIPVMDVLHWSWTQSVLGALAGFIGGALVGAACILTLLLDDASPNWTALLTLGALPAGIVGAAGGSLIAGLRTRAMEGTPASGQWLARHARNVLVACLIVGLTMGLCGTLGMATYTALTLAGDFFAWRSAVVSLGFGLGCAIISGTVAALYYGGFSLIQHVVLRLLLVAQRRIPWHLPRIADQAEDLVFLRRVGGGYIFIHRLVLEYFAALPEQRPG